MPRLSYFCVLASSCPHLACAVPALFPHLACAVFRRLNSAFFIATKSLNLNVRDLLASKFRGCSSDLNLSLFINLDRNLFAFYFTKDKIAPKRSVDLDYFRIFS